MSALFLGRGLSEFLTMWVASMLLVAVAISGPFALREMRQNWTELRGQFGIAFCLMAIGFATFLFTRWLYLQRAESEFPTFWDLLRPVTVIAMLIIAAGAATAIRAMTVQAHPREWILITGACAAVSAFLSWWF